MNPAIQQAVEAHLTQATQVIESQVDAEIERLDKLDDDDLEVLRRRRMDALKKAQHQKQEWLAIGHGKYEEVANEKEFFDACKKSKIVVCHFYRDSTFRCKIVDKHMQIIAPKHVETRFLKINAEKCKFLIEKLRIVVLPTICIAKDGKTTDYIVGFDDLGGRDDFPTELLEWRLGVLQAITYHGDLATPPTGTMSHGEKKDTSVFGFVKTKKTIKDGRGGDDSSDEDDW